MLLSATLQQRWNTACQKLKDPYRFSVQDYQQATGVSQTTAYQDLHTLVEQQVVQKIATGKYCQARHSRFFGYLNNLREELQQLLKRAFPQQQFPLGALELVTPPSLKFGDFALPCFNLARHLKRAPAQIAQTLAQQFQPTSSLAAVQAVGPYLNITVMAAPFATMVCQEILTLRENFGNNDLGAGQRVMVEYSSPNTNKPMHLGHIRNNLLGMTLATLLDKVGYEVIRANLINDRGIHICKSMLAYQKWGQDSTPAQKQEKGDHFVGRFYVMFENALKAERQAFAQQRGVNLEHFTKEYKRSLKDKQMLRQLEESEQQFEEDFRQHCTLYQQAQELLRKWEQGDADVRELWATMRTWVMDGLRQTYDTLGCTFDQYYYESETYRLGKEEVLKGVAQGVFTKRADGSVWVAAERLRQAAPQAFAKLPLKDKLLLRADGTSVYITQDIGTAIHKCQQHQLDQSLYVVASEQQLHFKTLFAILKLLGFSWAAGCRHISYGMVNLPRGQGKLKSREGTAVDADDLIAAMCQRAREVIESSEQVRVPADQIAATAQAVALAALKIFILQVSEEKDLHFDPAQTIKFTGDTGPAIQYSYARICGILRKAQEQGVPDLTPTPQLLARLATPEERALVRTLFDYPAVIRDAAQRYVVSPIPNYLLNLTKTFAAFYHEHRVLDAADQELRQARLLLCQAVAQVIKNGLTLLGIQALERM